MPPGHEASPAQLLGALVAQEVIAGEEVVDLQAVRARVPLADVALEESPVPDHVVAPIVRKAAFLDGPSAGLAATRGLHSETALRCPPEKLQVTIAQVAESEAGR